MPKLLAWLFLLVGIVLGLIGAFFTLGLAPKLETASGRFVVDLLGLLVLGLAPLGVGIGGMWYGTRRLRQLKHAATAQRDATLERTILQLARARPQGITLQECATNTPFSVQEVEAKLGNLYVDGVLDMEITEQGRLVYKLKTS